MPSESACSEPHAPRRSRGCAALALAVIVSISSACAHGAGGRREPPTTILEISSEAGDADVWVDGEYIGQVEAVSGKLKLRPGTHRVEIRKPGHFPVQRTVEVDRRGGGTLTVEAELLADPR